MRWHAPTLAAASLAAVVSTGPAAAFVLPVDLPLALNRLAANDAVTGTLKAAQHVAQSSLQAVGLGHPGQEEDETGEEDVQVLRFQAEDLGWDRAAVELVRGIAERLDYDIWHASPDRLDILLPSSRIAELAAVLPSGVHLPASPLLTSGDLSTLISAERTAAAAFNPPSSAGGSTWNVSTLASTFHNAYRPLEDVSAFLDALAAEFDGADKVVVGKSAEGRPIEALRVHLEANAGTYGVAQDNSKQWMRWSERYVEVEETDAAMKNKQAPEFFLMGGQHAREWISPASLLYFAHALLVKAQTDAGTKRLLENFVFTIVPTINPDGYVFSHGRSRLWKKNRQATEGRCVGIDMNANWGYKWSSNPSLAGAAKPCSDSYPGSAAFQAVETRAIADYIISPERNVRAFVDIHSYGQLFMFPYSYSCSDFPGDAETLMEAGLGVAKSIKADHGTVYKTGQACDLVYRMAGDSVDFAYGEAGVRWAYSAELRDTGTYGFLLPAHLIRPTAEEMASGLLYLAEFIRTTELGPR